jgi:MFS family permease
MTAPASGFRAFVILWCGQFISMTGSAFSSFALGVYVYRLTGSAATLGLIYALASLPFVIASPFTGSLVDRWGAQRALLVGNTGGLLVMLVLAGLLVLGAFTPLNLGVIVAFLAVLAALQMPAFEASVKLLVPERHLGRANGMRLLALATSQVLAPIGGGFLLLAIGIDKIVVIDCVTSGVGLLTLLCVRIPRARQEGTGTVVGLPTLLADFRQACRYVMVRRGLLALLALLSALEFCAGFVDLLIMPMILAFGSSGALGTVLSIGGIGMVAASLAMTVWGGPRRRVRGILGFTLLMAVATVVGSLRPNLTLLAVAAFVFMGALAIVIGSNQSFWQAKVEAQLLGRVMALQNMIAQVPHICAFALAGLMADQLFVPLVGRDRVRSPVVAMVVGEGPGRGFALLIMVMGLLLALCVVLAYLYPPLRHLDDELPDITGTGDAAPEEGGAVDPAGARV